ncbi:DUF1963 domain-containing protein [Stieleria varia]|uniref:DUF1963 domain-containing protein n=1 Tax=Stieleria varia TaxID=2528005 RepID=UPI0018D227A4|nr:DUF1963 domain-containing protein [Stieleria varia]
MTNSTPVPFFFLLFFLVHLVSINTALADEPGKMKIQPVNHNTVLSLIQGIEDLEQREFDLGQLKKITSDLGPPAFADYYIFEKGAGDCDFCTKLGGLPFVDNRFSWPVVNNKPMTFVAQLYLGESWDILNARQGNRTFAFDVISIFAESTFPDGSSHSIRVYGSNSRTGKRASASEVPDGVRVLTEARGKRFRLSIFPNAQHKGVFVNNHIDIDIAFPRGSFVSCYTKNIQPSDWRANEINEQGSGVAVFFGIDFVNLPELGLNLPKLLQGVHPIDRNWLSLGGGQVIVSSSSGELSSFFQR